MKKTNKKILSKIARSFFKTKIGYVVKEVAVADAMNHVRTIEYQGIQMKFSIPNAMNKFRVDTFATKEPETLEWLDRLPERSVLWDIGANIGLYSVYAAKRKKCRVVAFEPSVLNLELLARNLYLNGLQDQVTIIPLPLSDDLGQNLLKMTSTQWGGALSTFGKDFGWDGKPLKEVFAFQTYGISMDQAVNLLKLPPPDYIKMDVDGIEHCILQGGPQVLKQIQGIILEINDNFIEQKRISQTLLQAGGLVFQEKRHSEMFATSEFQDTFNQIWNREVK